MTAQQRALAEVAAQASAMTERLLASNSTGDRAMARSSTRSLARIPLDGSAPSVNGIVMLPVLVFGAETAAPMRATPVALIHTLWWAAARYLDDMIDTPQLARSNPAEFNRGVMTAIAVGNYLPLNIFGDLAVSDAVRFRLITEYSNGCIDALGGQLTDLVLNAETATSTIAAQLRGQDGRLYGMSAALAAQLAERDADRSMPGARSVGRSECFVNWSTTSATWSPSATRICETALRPICSFIS